VGAARLGRATAAALARKVAEAGLRVAFQGEQATAAEVAAALGGGGAAFLLLPPGESGELGRALIARGVRVVDLGADQRRLPHVACALSPEAAGRRMLSMPSPGALAAWLSVRPLLEAGLVQADRLAVVLLAGDAPDEARRASANATAGGSAAAVAGGSAAAVAGGAAAIAADASAAGAAVSGASAPAGAVARESSAAGGAAGASGAAIADELSWLAGRPLRATCEIVRVPIGRALLAVVQAEAARDLDPGELRAALEAHARSDWLFAQPGPCAARVCEEPESPDTARVSGTSTMELAARDHGFAERVTILCALDAVEFTAGAALAALGRLRPAG
jgi:N-acetyl-gamma-glutamylphosphate reductase